MRTTIFRVLLVLACVIASSNVPTMAPQAAAATGPQLRSLGPLSFGPDGTLYAADSAAAMIYALDLGAQATAGTKGTTAVAGIDQKIAAMLGTDTRDIAITDLVVHPATHNAYLSVMRGQGPAAKPALVRVDGAGTLTVIDTNTLTFTSVELPNAARAGNDQRNQSITQIKFANGRVWVSGLSNEEFASKLWSIAYPFSNADRGTSLEIFHDNHEALETRAPMYAFVPYAINGQPHIVGAYTCTPLVTFPVSALTPNAGSKFRGTTIGELGAGNRPIDMIVYTKNAKDYLLMANTSRGVMKIPTDTFSAAKSITTPSRTETAGVPFEKITSMTAVRQLTLLDQTHSLVVQGTAPLNLQPIDLP